MQLCVASILATGHWLVQSCERAWNPKSEPGDAGSRPCRQGPPAATSTRRSWHGVVSRLEQPSDHAIG